MIKDRGELQKRSIDNAKAGEYPARRSRRAISGLGLVWIGLRHGGETTENRK